LKKEFIDASNKEKVMDKISEMEKILDGSLQDDYTHFYDDLKSVFEEFKTSQQKTEIEGDTKTEPKEETNSNFEPSIEEID
jgi:hypothetical protein